MSFDDFYKNVAARYLQNVLLADDEIVFSTEISSDEGKSAEGSPGTLLYQDAGNGIPDLTQAVGELQSPVASFAESKSHPISAAQIVDGFGRLGIFATFILPYREGGDHLPFQTLAESADVIVLDWVVPEGNGVFALNVVKYLRDKAPARLRLVVIYTGDPGALEDIATEVRNALMPEKRKRPVPPSEKLLVELDNFKIIVIGKIDKEEDSTQERCSWGDLPERIVAEYAAITAGLLPGVVMTSLAILRERSGKLVRALSPAMDPAYLWHRVNLPHPRDSEDLLLSMVVSEIHSLLLDSEAADAAGLEAIKAWIRSKSVDDWADRIGANRAVSTEEVLSFLEFGFAKGSENGAKADELTDGDAGRLFWEVPAFSDNKDTMIKLNQSLASRASFRSVYDNRRFLRIGTIIETGQGQLYLCIQPLCDSVRIADSRKFTFLQLFVKNEGEPCDFVLAKGNKNLRLSVAYRLHNIRMWEFSGNPAHGGAVAAHTSGGSKEFVFVFSSVEHEQLWWRAELRLDHALRIAQRFSYEALRIGVDDAEWLRLTNQRAAVTQANSRII